jgi:hypothetical protein
MTPKQLNRLARDLAAYRDVYLINKMTMVEAARRAKVHRTTLHRRVAALPAALIANLERSVRRGRAADRGDRHANLD